MKRRWPLVLLASIILLIAIAIVVTLVSSRSVEGAVPGKAPLLGLAVADGRYFAASETGLFVSSDGKTWSKPEMFSGKPALVVSLGDEGAALVSGGKLFVLAAQTAAGETGEGRRSDEKQDKGSMGGALRFREFPAGRIRATAMASSEGSVYMAQDARNLVVISGDCLVALSTTEECTETGLAATLRLNGGPDEILALDVVPREPPILFAGGLKAGVWRSSTPQKDWKRVLQTATRAIMVDDRNPERIFLGTAGGLLVSSNQGLSWSFSEMRQPVEAISQAGGSFFVLAGDRLVYVSADGAAWKPAQS